VDNGGWALSPDGRRLAIGLSTNAGDDIWIKQLPRGPLSRLTFDSTPDFRPRWMPDGRSVMFVGYRAGRGELYRRSADGTGGDELVLRRSGILEGAVSRDGRWLIFRIGGSTGIAGGRDILGLRLGVDSVPMPLVATANFDESAIAISPDGRWLAYESNETGHTEVYVRPFPTTEAGKWQVSTGGGSAPLWAPSGRELFYVSGAREMVVAAVTPGPSLQVGERRVLFRLRDELYVVDGQRYTPFDIAPDGRQFIMARRVRSEAGQVAPFVVVTNWFEELKQKMGGR
jgi:serine/threonine-protein kinase